MEPPVPSETPAPAPAVVEAEIEATEQEAEDIDELSEQLAVHSIISEERHDQIINEVSQCQTQLEQLSTRLGDVQNPDNPILHQILQQVAELRAELTALKSSLDLMSSNRRPQESTPPPEQPATARENAEEGRPVPPEQPKRRKRSIL